MYDKFETFNLYLYQISQAGAMSAAPTSAIYQLVDIKIKGLPFLNNGYNMISGNNTQTAKYRYKYSDRNNYTNV